MARTSTRLVSVFALSFVTILATSSAFAQEAAQVDTSERVLDSVTVTGIQNDDAMAAFRAGDYATAELEFLDNAMCALRRERSLTASAETAQIDSVRAESFANAAGTTSGASSRGAGAGQPQSSPTGIATPSGVAARNVVNTTDSTCEALGRQLYFAGLSQIQLGKTDDALRSLERATAASRIIYDAHYKIGLIKLLKGDTASAASELRKIEGILKRCRKCDARQEIIARRDHLSKAIKGEIALQ